MALPEGPLLAELVAPLLQRGGLVDLRRRVRAAQQRCGARPPRLATALHLSHTALALTLRPTCTRH